MHRGCQKVQVLDWLIDWLFHGGEFEVKMMYLVIFLEKFRKKWYPYRCISSKMILYVKKRWTDGRRDGHGQSDVRTNDISRTYIDMYIKLKLIKWGFYFYSQIRRIDKNTGTVSSCDRKSMFWRWKYHFRELICCFQIFRQSSSFKTNFFGVSW